MYSINERITPFRNNKHLESAVKATYSFEKPKDFKFYKHLGATELSSTVDLYVLQSTEKIIGFIGVSGKHLKILFVDANSIGKGHRATLLNYAVEYLSVKTLDIPQKLGWVKIAQYCI